MNKYCKFKESIFDGKKLIWQKGKEYLVTYENEEIYQFDNGYGIEKTCEGKKFIVIEKEDKFDPNEKLDVKFVPHIEYNSDCISGEIKQWKIK